MLNKIKTILGGAVGICTTLFIITYLTAWFCNALYASKFDLGALQNMYLTIIVPIILKHGTDSVFNSGKGEQPK
jgi:hypothetical protein